MFKRLLIPSLFLLAIVLISSCGSSRKTGFALQSEIWEETDADTGKKEIYLTGTKPIDSVDQSKLIVDVWTVEIDDYPDEVRLKSRVFDSSGNFVTNMADPYKLDSNANYWVSLNETLGKVLKRGPIDIENFTVREFGAGDSIPYNIVLSVDYSGSMSGVMEAIFEGTEIFVGMKHPYDNIGLTSFNKDFDVKVPMMNDSNKILNIYRTRKTAGFGLFSAVNDAALNCVDMLDSTDEEVPRVMVLFSDGDDNYSKKKIGEVIERAKEEKVHIFTVAFGYTKDKNMRYMAEYTGGKFYKARSKEELIAIFRDIYMSLRYYYLVSYKPPRFWGYHLVEVGVKVPDREDSLFAYGEYDSKDMFPWDDIGDIFERPIQFDYNKAVIKDESIYIIEEVADAMLSLPKLKLEIQGHTDNIGGVEFNMDLSNRRAQSVMDALIGYGIDPRRLRSRGFGFSDPVAPNDTEENRAKNRRTQFEILAK